MVCGVSSLGIDHTSILGDTMEKIAWQKGGIFKVGRPGPWFRGALPPGAEHPPALSTPRPSQPGVPAFTVAQPKRPLEVLRDRAREREVSLGVDGGVPHGGGLSLLSPQCPLYLCPELDAFEGGRRALELGLAGTHQRSNAALALQLARTWLQRRGKAGGRGRGWGGLGPRVGPCRSPQGLSGAPIPPGLGELKEVLPGAELAGRPVPLAPAFRPTNAMVQGAVWPCRDPPLAMSPGSGGATLRPCPLPTALEGAAWLPVLRVAPAGVPELDGGPSHAPCVVPPPGLRETEWLGRTQVLPRGPVTWYLDGAHTTSSVQACVRWFRQVALNQEKPHE